MKKIIFLGLFFALVAPINSETYRNHKLTCPSSGGICNEEERKVVKLVNDTYWVMLSERIKKNKFYKDPWYWVYKKKNECKYTVAAKEDMLTHTVTMEWIDVDICKKKTKLIDLGLRR